MKNPVRKLQKNKPLVTSFRVDRGGGWWEHQEVKGRDRYHPEATDSELGFRIARNSKEKK